MGRSRVDAAVEELLSRVVSGTYPAGTALPGEAALASDLSVSRLTAREATRGVLSSRQGSGTYVNEPEAWQDLGSLVALARRDGSEREVGLALLEVRRMLEVGSAGLAAARITDDRLQAMESAIAELRRADAADDVDAAAAADLCFHNHIIKAASNPFVSVTFAPLRDELVVARRITSSCHKVRAHAVTQHEHILTALRLGSPDAAQAAMRAHMDQTTNDLLEYIT